MSHYAWRPFLEEWSHEILAVPKYRQRLPPEVIASGWLGFPGATQDELEQLEQRLGRTLPLSYREFLSVTNGWHMTGSFIPRLWSCAEVDWFVARNRETVETWMQAPIEVTDEEYFNYDTGNEGAEGATRVEYLPFALQISATEEYGTAVYLLNPEVVTADGEWEAWFFAHWVPGAVRYRSFWSLLQAERADMLT
jgi:hypothetical protein